MQNKFTYRSHEAEMLDAPDIPKDLLYRNLRELDVINARLGGHSVTLEGMKRLLTDRSRTYHIVDIGCGGGDAIRRISKWCSRNGIKVRITGVDMNADCIRYMLDNCSDLPQIEGVVSDYRDYLRNIGSVDVIHCSLFCHHLSDKDLQELFIFMQKYTRRGFVINDLQRHWFAYYSIFALTRIFNGSRLVRNDAPLSVRRGFRRNELQAILQNAGVNRHSIEWKWAFRFLVLHKKEQPLEL